ncbi:MAG TPA: TatD family hydrolase [Chitinophagaceae bacterium]|mgnify:CR=1 FL=1|nr:TatD family hydrolase [Chitinophagaceae bacterium]
MTLIDTHSHIYLGDFDADRDDIIQTSENEGVKRILLPAIDSATHDKMIGLEEIYPGVCVSMMGLHPCSIKADYKSELKIARDFLDKRTFIAIGETGLDFYWDKTFTKEQYDAFNEQIVWAIQYQIPVVIHSRNSTDECIEVVKGHQKGNLKGVFHCFSGSIEQAQEVIDLGFYLGIGGVVTFKNSGLDKIVKDISLDHLVLETDAPYLAPVPFRGKRNEPSYLKYVLEKLSQIKEADKEEIASITTINAQKLFGI